jgi:hypothetical protein
MPGYLLFFISWIAPKRDNNRGNSECSQLSSMAIKLSGRIPMPPYDHPPRMISSHLLDVLWRCHNVTQTQRLIGREVSPQSPQPAVGFMSTPRHSGGRFPIVDWCRPYSLKHDGFQTTISKCGGGWAHGRPT